jgi:ParB family chromosome partitioning protein
MKAPIEKIIPNPDQPRTVFDQAELESLASTIRKHGVIQPVVVEQVKDYFILVDGERRWRASKIAGLKKIPITLAERTNHNGIERLTKALIANVQRSAMGPVDEGKAYQRLLQDLGTIQAVADDVGVSIATVSIRLALLHFPDEVQHLFNLRRLSLDPKVVAALKQLSKTRMTRVALQAAMRGGSIRILLRLVTLELKGAGKTYAPRARTAPEPVLVDGHFSALSLVDGKELPVDVCLAANKTCKACPLYPEASPANCRQCPLPDFLRRL